MVRFIMYAIVIVAFVFGLFGAFFCSWQQVSDFAGKFVGMAAVLLIFAYIAKGLFR